MLGPQTPTRSCARAAPAWPTASELLVVAGVALVNLLALYGLITERGGLFKDDTRHYVQMAEQPATLTRLPYSFRVLTPLIVSLLPVDTLTAFTIVTLSALWLAALLLYVLILGLSLGRWPAAAAAAIFLGSGAVTHALTTPLYVDAVSYVVELAVFACLLWRRETLLVLTLVIGTLNRETTLLLTPVYFFWRRLKGGLGRSDPLRGAHVLLVPLAALALVVAAKLILADRAGQGLETLQWNQRAFRDELPSPQTLADIYSTFGAAWLLALANLWRAPVLLRCGLVYGLLMLLQLSIARGDEGRVLSHLLPLVLPLAALEFQRQGRLAGGLLLFAVLASMIDFRWIILPSATLRFALVASGTVVALGLALRARLRARSPA